MKILIAEDDDNKQDHIRRFVEETFPGHSIQIAGSYQSALKKLIGDRYELLLLDMTLPTFDKGQVDSPGRLRQLGGQELLDQLDRRSISISVVIVTGYDTVGVGKAAVSLDNLRIELRERYPKHFQRAVFYNRSEDKWKAELKGAIEFVLSIRTPT